MGSTSAPDRKRDEQNAIAAAFAVLIAIGFFFPQLLFGGLLGAGLGGIAPPRIDDPARRRAVRGMAPWSIATGLTIGGLLFALRAPLALEAEGRRFHRAWKSDGIDAGALIEYPWGWLPESAAIALVVAGIFLLWRTR
ncbi:MAG: hypothetical protein ACR2G3_05240 [Solirubrobacterales bacterium]